MRATWATDYFGTGNAYGYSLHNRRAREAVQRAGVTLTDAADVAVHVCPAHLFAPLDGKRNVLFMAWETENLPPHYVEQIRKADAVAVTASFLVPVVRRHAPGLPVFHCPLGVDAAAFPYRRRQRLPGQPFRFLWVGAPNARKGWELVLQAWRVFAGDPKFELVIKTTVAEKRERIGNVIFDSRDYTQPELTALYHSAHVFLFPSFGEGFGLTMAEAMATGLPVIYTPWSAMTDLADASCGYPLRYRMIPAWALDDGALITEARGGADLERIRERYGMDAVRTSLAQADVIGLVERMAEVARNYARAQEKARRGAERMRERFTWERTGRILARVIRAASREAVAVNM